MEAADLEDGAEEEDDGGLVEALEGQIEAGVEEQAAENDLDNVLHQIHDVAVQEEQWAEVEGDCFPMGETDTDLKIPDGEQLISLMNAEDEEDASECPQNLCPPKTLTEALPFDLLQSCQGASCQFVKYHLGRFGTHFIGLRLILRLLDFRTLIVSHPFYSDQGLRKATCSPICGC